MLDIIFILVFDIVFVKMRNYWKKFISKGIVVFNP